MIQTKEFNKKKKNSWLACYGMGHSSLLDYFYVGVGWGLVRGLERSNPFSCLRLHKTWSFVSIKDATECMDSGAVHSIVRGLEK